MKNLVEKTVFPLLILVLFSACSKEEVEPPAIILESQEVSGEIIFPEVIQNVGNLKIVSGIYEGEIELKKSGLVGECNINLNKNTIQLITIFNDDEPILYCLANPNQTQTLTINAITTAEALVFLHPLIVSSDPIEATEIRAKIRNSNSFNYLVQELEDIIGNGQFHQIGWNLSYFTTVTGEVINEIIDNYQEPQNGIELSDVDKTQNPLRLKILNGRKRWLSIYIDKYAGGNLTSSPFTINNEEVNTFLMPSDEASLWNIFTKGTPIEAESPLVSINTSDAEKIKVSCYGLGINNFPDVSSQDFDRGVSAAAATFLWDYGIAFFEVITGVKGLKGELRGRPFKNPNSELISRLEAALTHPTSRVKYVSAAQSGDNSAFLKEIFKIGYSTLIDSENAKLVYQFIKKITTKDIAASIVNKAFVPLRIIDMTESIGNMGASVYATISTDWKTEFLINVNDLPTDGLLAHYPFNGNAYDEIGNNDGTVYGATLTTDRFGNSDRAYSLDGTDDYISFGNMYLPTEEFTYAIWLKDLDQGTHGAILGKHSYQGDNQVYLRTEINDDKYDLEINIGNNFYELTAPYRDEIGLISPSYNKFDHLVATYDGQIIKLYVNNTLVGSQNATGTTATNSHPLLLGHSSASNNNHDDYGKYIFDDFRIYTRALKVHEINELYNEE